MPRLNSDTKICGHSDELCLALITLEMQFKTDENFRCNCLPGCHEISFNVISTTNIPFNRKNFRLKDVSPTNTTLLRVFYKENNFRSQRKSEVFGLNEFLCKGRVERIKLIYFFE